MPILRIMTRNIKGERGQRKILVKYRQRRTNKRWKHAGTLFVPRSVAYLIQDMAARVAEEANDVTTCE